MGMVVRPAVEADVEDVICVCDQAWGNVWKGDRPMFIDRITAFPEGGIVVSEIDGFIEGYVSVQVADADVILRPTWDEATDFGHLTKTHNPEGEWLHGVGLAMTPRGSEAGLTRELIQYLFRYAIAKQKRGCRFITRIPGYYRYQEKLSPEEYVRSRRNDRPIDPELRVLGNYGFEVVEPPVIFTDYVEGGGDPRSCGLSVLIEQLNPYWAEVPSAARSR